MKVLIMNIKENKTKRLQNVKTVMNRGYHFTVVFNDGTEINYDFHEYDYFINH